MQMQTMAPVEKEQKFDEWMQPFDSGDYEQHDFEGGDLSKEIPFDEAVLQNKEPLAVAPPAPVKPAADVVAERNLRHAKFESWREACVAGRAQAKPHRRRDHAEEETPVIQMGYLMEQGLRGERKPAGRVRSEEPHGH